MKNNKYVYAIRNGEMKDRSGASLIILLQQVPFYARQEQ